jgi:ATP-binding cassette subfamily C protein CydC
MSAAALLGLSGWFIAGAAAAGLSGAALAFNYLLPSAGIRALAIARTASRYGERLFSHSAALGVMATLRPALFGAIVRGRPEAATAITTGDASAALVQDVAVVEAVSIDRAALATAIAGTLTGLGAAALGGGAALSATFGMMAALALGAWLIAERAAPDATATVLAANAALKREAALWIDAAAELACYGIAPNAHAAIAARSLALADASARRVRRNALFAAWPHMMAGLAASVVLICAADRSAPLAAAACLGALVGLEALAAGLRLIEQARGYRAAKARLEACFTPERPPSPAPRTFRIGAREIELSQGRRVVVTGPSGSGKTTALEYLIGLRGDAPLTPERFAYAPQDAAALTGTVRDNLVLGDCRVEDADLWKALAASCLDERVQAWPQGLDTWVGDGGMRLSGGERRRLAIARALAQTTDWLVLDEPSEGLDAATERALIAAIDRRLRATGQGLILVTHRPAWLELSWDERVNLEPMDQGSTDSLDALAFASMSA